MQRTAFVFFFIGLVVGLLHATSAAPQFVTFKDGKVGVNFGGYHASAGLGGLLTGNAAHGGLSAAAGTPFGPKAAAGLGGSVDGKTSGIAYAGAEVSPSLGASTVLGGVAGTKGFSGSEAHADGKVVSKTRTVIKSTDDFAAVEVTASPALSTQKTIRVQKHKPPKKYFYAEPAVITSERNRNRTKIIETKAAAAAAPRPLSTVTLSATTVGGASIGSGDDLGGTRTAAVLISPNHKHQQRRQRKRSQRQFARQAQQELARQRLDPEPGAGLLQRQQQAPAITDTVDDTVVLTAPNTEVTTAANVPAPATGSKVIITKKIVKSVKPLGAKTVTRATAGTADSDYGHPQANTGTVFNALNIPIGILRSLQESLSGLTAPVSIHKSLNIN